MKNCNIMKLKVAYTFLWTK